MGRKIIRGPDIKKNETSNKQKLSTNKNWGHSMKVLYGPSNSPKVYFNGLTQMKKRKNNSMTNNWPIEK